MPTDVLSLGGIVFDQYSTPRDMPFGGEQAMVVHKLPGGARVIDTLGPDEADVFFFGFFFGDNAYASALAIDAMRAAGQVVPLVWGGQYRSVIIRHFLPRVRRMPLWVMYEVSCTVVQNPMLGALGGIPSTMDSLVLSDLALAASL
ncbi:hypothetical protein [Bradyrhizobium sp. ORS 86]|uniref:hypothetical protein n=1 Tax=Bradyrhizobium sp. ORS 86 TaxID=1685970 RepID=UPI00388DEBD6